MAAQLHRLRTKADRLRSDTAAQLRQLVLEYPGLPERARGEIIGTIDRQTASEAGWTFVMLSPEQNAAVMRWLRGGFQNSLARRPATRKRQAAWSRDWTMNPSRS